MVRVRARRGSDLWIELVPSSPQTAPALTKVFRTIAVALALTAGACGEDPGPVEVVLWTWSTGARNDETMRLVTRFNDAATGVTVKAVPWPVTASEAPTGLPFVEALLQNRRGPDEPALLELPEEALVSAVEGEFARDMSGSLAEQLGLRFDDFEPWLATASRVRSEGVAGLPFHQEVPLIVGPSGSGVAERVRSGGVQALTGAAGATPLAAAADYRLLLWAIAETGALRVPEGEGEPTLDAACTREAFALLRSLLGAGAAERGAGGERRALAALEAGQASAALIWSGTLAGPDVAGRELEVVRAPLRTRGTFLVVHAGAPWRPRQAALRVARWMTEPISAAALASRLWLAPIRASAARGAAYADAAGPRAWRREVAAPDRPLLLPARGAFVDALATDAERALRTMSLEDSLLERLQSTLRRVEHEARPRMRAQPARGEGA